MANIYLLPQHTQALVQGGLTKAQASLYETLLQQGPLTARRAAFMAGISRTLGYKILGELEALGLVVKKEKTGTIALFTAAHPLKLKELAEKRLQEATEAKIALDEALSRLVPDFYKSFEQ